MPCARRLTLTAGKRFLTSSLMKMAVLSAEGQHQFPYLALRKPVLEPFEIQFVGIPVVQRAEQTAEDEVLPPVEAASVHGHHAVPVSDEAQDILRTRGVLADGADIGRGKASAAPADMQLAPRRRVCSSGQRRSVMTTRMADLGPMPGSLLICAARSLRGAGIVLVMAGARKCRGDGCRRTDCSSRARGFPWRCGWLR